MLEINISVDMSEAITKMVSMESYIIMKKGLYYGCDTQKDMQRERNRDKQKEQTNKY